MNNSSSSTSSNKREKERKINQFPWNNSYLNYCLLSLREFKLLQFNKK